jgi:hypothetical protein
MLTALYWECHSVHYNKDSSYLTLFYTQSQFERKQDIPLKVKNVAIVPHVIPFFKRVVNFPTPDNRISEYFRSLLKDQSPAEFLDLNRISRIMEAFPESTSVDTYEDGYIAISYASMDDLSQVIYDHGDMIRVDRFLIVFEENVWRSSCNWKVRDSSISHSDLRLLLCLLNLTNTIL